MRRFSLYHSLSTVVAALSLMAANPSHAQLVTPTGLNAGDTFRFVFLTPGGTAATSSSIGTYDTFVNAQAGGVTYNGAPITWQAIGSTATDSAARHIGNNPGLSGIYLTSGLLVESGPESQLWALQTIQNTINVGPTGILDSGGPLSITVWTGSNADGTASTNPLGFTARGIPQVTFANALDTSSNWITGPIGNGNISEQVYAISEVLTVSSSAVPEPTPLLMGLSLTGVAATLALSRRRRATRR